MTSLSNPKPKQFNIFLPWLDVLTLNIWGILLLKYWLTGELHLLIHKDFFWLVVVTGILLIILGAIKAGQLLLTILQPKSKRRIPVSTEQHISLFPPGWSSGLLIIVAIAGLLISPKIFNSQTAIERGVGDSITMTRAQTQQFRTSTKSEERSLVDWIRTLNVYPEPDAYAGQKVKVKGFVIHPPELPQEYILISRFVITCCAADAYPVGLPVKLTENRNNLAPDTWLEIEGMMITETLGGKRQLVIEKSAIKKIPTPTNPYDY